MPNDPWERDIGIDEIQRRLRQREEARLEERRRNQREEIEAEARRATERREYEFGSRYASPPTPQMTFASDTVTINPQFMQYNVGDMIDFYPIPKPKPRSINKMIAEKREVLVSYKRAIEKIENEIKKMQAELDKEEKE